QSRAGAEKYHSAMVPHAGTDADVWRSTVRLGAALRALAPARGSRIESEVALVFDYQAWWGAELDSHPTQHLDSMAEVLRYYRRLWLEGVSVDIVPAGADLSGYRAVLVPTLYLLDDDAADRIAEAARGGAS